MIFVPLLTEKVTNRLGLLTLFRSESTKTTGGTNFKTPVIGSQEGLHHHQSLCDPYLLRLFHILYSNRDFLFLDVRVNFGRTLLKIKSVNRNASYTGIEPSGLCPCDTSLLFTVNALPNCKLIRCALSNTPGMLTLYGQSDGDTRVSISKEILDQSEIKNEETVAALKLDAFVGEFKNNIEDVVLKVDVDGAEHLVLEYAEETVDKFRPVILFKDLPSRSLKDRISNQSRLTTFLLQKGYCLFILDEIAGCIRPVDSIYNLNDSQLINYVALPGEKENLLEIFSRKMIASLAM